MMGLIYNNSTKIRRLELLQPLQAQQCLVRRDSPARDISCSLRSRVRSTHKSALPDALYFAPCSISTDQSGRSFCARTAVCRASSMLLTTTSERRASAFLASSRESNDMKTAVLPAPVGRDTPIRRTPASNASKHASRQASWYGRRVNVDDQRTYRHDDVSDKRDAEYEYELHALLRHSMYVAEDKQQIYRPLARVLLHDHRTSFTLQTTS